MSAENRVGDVKFCIPGFLRSPELKNRFSCLAETAMAGACIIWPHQPNVSVSAAGLPDKSGDDETPTLNQERTSKVR